MIGVNVKEECHKKIKDPSGGGKFEEHYEHKGVLGGGEKVEHHIREDAGDFGGGRNMDYQRKDNPDSGTHSVDYHATEGEKAKGILDKAGRALALGLKK